MSTEAEMIANQSAYIPPTEDQVKIIKAKELMALALPHIGECTEPFENDEGYARYSLINKITAFIQEA